MATMPTATAEPRKRITTTPRLSDGVGMASSLNVRDHVTQLEKRRPIKGDLIFDANFECGNLGNVVMLNEFEYDLFIRPDTGNQKQRIWFYFSVRNCVRGQRVIFNIVNYCKCKSVYRDGMTPVMRSTSRPNWERMQSDSTFYYKCPSRKKGYVLSFALVFDQEETYEVAFSFPYTYTALQSYLGMIAARKLGYFRRERLAITLQKRRVDLLTITAPENMELGDQATPRHTVFVSARVHAGETPSSFMMQGFLDFLLSDNDEAALLRKNVIFKIVPMLNPDGVVLGNYRCSSAGLDLNRCYTSPKNWSHPEIVAVKHLLRTLTTDSRYSLLFYVDLHAHTASTNSFLYGNWHDDIARMKAQWVFPKLLAAHADDFSEKTTDFNSDKAKAGTGRRAVIHTLSQQAQIFTLEVSFYAYKTRQNTVVPYSQQRYRDLGVAIARSFCDYYRPL
eukprot:m.91087 g.91087  ORF g.91087 m.91087 type:complete len:449 (+) comp26444_c0_seq2:444-1790(+)